MTRRQGRQSPAIKSSITGEGSGWDPVNDFLVTCLQRIDERLLVYLDTHCELTVSAVQRLRLYTRATLDGSMTPRQVADEWPDWFLLTPAFVAAYGTWELADLQSGARFLAHARSEDLDSLNEAERVYLTALKAALDAYPEVRTAQ